MDASAPPDAADVLIVGGGPCGLMLANELGRRGVSVALVDEKPGTAVNPQANATQARTMEHYRRLGFADEIRALGLPPDHPTDAAYFTRFARHELARVGLPTARQAKALAETLSGSWSAAELPHRVSQKFVEPVLRRHAEALPGVSLAYGWRLVSFAHHDDHVRAELEQVEDGRRVSIQARYLVGADGARSTVRQGLGIRYAGAGGAVRELMGGRMYAIYLRAPGYWEQTGHGRAWMQVTFNPERRAFMCSIDGEAEFAFHTQLRPGEQESDIDDAQALAMFHAAAGAPIEAEVLSRGGWNAGYSLVAERFQRGRVLLAGDAVHLFTPAGGLGYNTAVEDAVNLGWKLAQVIKGVSTPGLLDSYEAERRPLALRNTAYARGFADSLGLLAAPPEIEDDTPAGEAARAEASAYFERHAREEFIIPGVTFGGRYDASPLIAHDGTEPPPDTANVYVPSACPGGRAPHAWLNGRSLFDLFGFEWTLLRLDESLPVEPLMQAAAARGLDLKRLDLLDHAVRDLYQASLALIRPDQIVAWRGDRLPDDAAALLAKVAGPPP